MAKTTKNPEQDNAPVVAAQNSALAAIGDNFALLEKFENADDNQLTELTSNLLKLEAGEVWNGIIVNQFDTMESTDADGKPYDVVVGYDKNKNRVSIADAVVLSCMRSHFEKNADQPFALARLSCKGMKQSTKDSKREYRDISVRILS